MMVAGHLGYLPGKFCHFVQNLHVYDRHFEAVDEILKRTPLDKQPSIELVEKKKFYEYTIDDFIVKDIDGINKLRKKLEIAI